MPIGKLINNYAAFNTWANEHLINYLIKFPVDTLTQQIPSSFNSIDYTFQHILRTQVFWTTFVCNQDFSSLNWNVIENSTIEKMTELLSQSALIQKKISEFSELELEGQLALNMPWAKGNLPRYEYIFHCINHSTYHRGQIITIARNLGITENIPSTDYNFFNLQKNA